MCQLKGQRRGEIITGLPDTHTRILVKGKKNDYEVKSSFFSVSLSSGNTTSGKEEGDE